MLNRARKEGKLFKLLQETKSFISLYTTALTFSLLAVAATLAFPLAQRALFDDALLSGQSGKLPSILLTMFSLAVAMIIFQALSDYLLTLIGEKVSINLRIRFTEHVYSLKGEFIQSRAVGDLISTATHDIGVISGFYTSVLGGGVISILRLVATLVLLAIFDLRLILIALPVLVVYAIAPIVITPHLRKASEATQHSYAQLISTLEETLSSIRDVKVSGSVLWALRRKRSVSEDLLVARIRQTKLGLLTLSSFIAYWGVVIVVSWYGGQAILSGELSVGTLVALLFYFGQLEEPVSSLIDTNNQIQSIIAAAERLYKYLDIPLEHASQVCSEHLPGSWAPASIEVRELGFAYDSSTNGVQGITLKVVSGAFVAIVGQTGSGKTTLVKLLLGFLQAQQGSILIDGKPIQEIGENELRKLLGVSFADSAIFNMSILDNICFGKADASRSEVEQAAYLAGADEFIKKLPSGYKTLVGERGEKLSTGQKQRLSLARALIRRPALLLLDEATSGLDNETESVVLKRLMADTNKPTIIMVTHRPNSLQRANKVVVLEEGRIANTGMNQESHSKVICISSLDNEVFIEGEV